MGTRIDTDSESVIPWYRRLLTKTLCARKGVVTIEYEKSVSTEPGTEMFEHEPLRSTDGSEWSHLNLRP